MWRFVHMTDPHLASQRDGVWNNRFLCTMMPEVMACLRRDLTQLRPEFLLVTGDICSHQTRAAMLEARDLMDSLGTPYYPMGGNHDFVQPESRTWFHEAFARRLPDNNTVYSFSCHNLHFCVLDPWWMWSDGSLSPVGEASVVQEQEVSLDNARWALPPEQFTWLEKDLKEHAGMPTVIAVHEPLLPPPPRMQQPGYKDSGALENGELLLTVLREYPQVCAVFSGHMHMNYIEHACGITQVVTSALPEYPTEIREVCVYLDRLVVRTLGLSDPTFAQRSLIEGKSWTRGEAQDRETIIWFS